MRYFKKRTTGIDQRSRYGKDQLGQGGVIEAVRGLIKNKICESRVEKPDNAVIPRK